MTSVWGLRVPSARTKNRWTMLSKWSFPFQFVFVLFAFETSKKKKSKTERSEHRFIYLRIKRSANEKNTDVTQQTHLDCFFRFVFVNFFLSNLRTHTRIQISLFMHFVCGCRNSCNGHFVPDASNDDICR